MSIGSDSSDSKDDVNTAPPAMAQQAVERLHTGYRNALETYHALSRRVAQAGQHVAARLGPVTSPIGKLFGNTLIMRFISRSLLRRIIASNLLGLVILLAGLTYLIQFNSWLIDAKIEHLRAQSHIMAAAIASKTSLGQTEDASGTNDPLRDNPFAALEFSIQPELVVPLLRQLLEQTRNRGRVYDVSGVLIADSSQILRQGSIIPIRPNRLQDEPKPKTENNLTRLMQWMMNSDLRVYKDIGRANGRFYPEVKAALLGESTALMMLAAKRQTIVSVATPIIRGGQVRGALLLSTAPGEIDDVQENELFAVMLLISVAAAAALLASILLARTVARPVHRLSEYAKEVTHDIQAAKDLPRFDDRADEVGQLARSFSLMTSALYRRIEASEKFAADVAHELKNPLTAARSTAESLAYCKTDAQRDEFVAQIQHELKRLNKLISDVSAASRLDAEMALQKFEAVDLTSIVNTLAETFRGLPMSEHRNIAVAIEPRRDGAYVILCQDGRIEQVLTNLLANALSFTPPGGTVTVRLRRNRQGFELVVEDQGPGILPENLEDVFARFYTYRPTANTSRGENSGLGLAISREIVETHGGRIWAENILSPDRAVSPSSASQVKPLGARFIVQLPLRGATANAVRGRLRGGR